MRDAHATPAGCVVPGTARDGERPIQIGGIGVLTDAAAFGGFPALAVGREIHVHG